MVEDAFLLIALMALLAFHPSGALVLALAAAIPAVVVWSRLTLHRPTRVDIDEEGIAFGAHGREHRFAFRDVERILVRRFVLRDRVLVRIAPASALRGRYWLRDSLDGYAAILAKLDERAKWLRASPAPREASRPEEAENRRNRA
jgi:hypothetical protein